MGRGWKITDRRWIIFNNIFLALYRNTPSELTPLLKQRDRMTERPSHRQLTKK